MARIHQSGWKLADFRCSELQPILGRNGETLGYWKCQIYWSQQFFYQNVSPPEVTTFHQRVVINDVVVLNSF